LFTLSRVASVIVCVQTGGGRGPRWRIRAPRDGRDRRRTDRTAASPTSAGSVRAAPTGTANPGL